MTFYKGPKQFFGLTIRNGSVGTPLCRRDEGVFFPLFFPIMPPFYFFQRKKNCSRIYWDRLLSSSRGKKLNIIINLKCYFFYQPEVKFSQEAEGHLKHLSNPTLPAKFRSETRYFLLTATQQLKPKAISVIIFDLKRRSSSKCSFPLRKQKKCFFAEQSNHQICFIFPFITQKRLSSERISQHLCSCLFNPSWFQ